MPDKPADGAPTERPGQGPVARVPRSGLVGPHHVAVFAYTSTLGRMAQGVVMAWGGSFVAFRNECPHWSVEFTRRGTVQLDLERGQLVCWRHGARFGLGDGVCTDGPCQGEVLERFEVRMAEADAEVLEIWQPPGLAGSWTSVG